MPEGVFRAWFHADDIGAEDLSEALDMLPDWLAHEIDTRWRRGGADLGTIVLIDSEGREVWP